MPNWCYNQTVFYGDAKKLKEVYENIYQKYLKESWPHIDLFFRELGCTEEELNEVFAVRAHIVGLNLLDGGELELQYESAWNPINEILDEILTLHQPQIEQVTLAEECGMGVFINTDYEKNYFTEHYYLDLTITGENSNREENYNDEKYHDNLESVIHELKKFFHWFNFDNKPIDTEEDIMKIIEELEEFEDIYITFANFF